MSLAFAAWWRVSARGEVAEDHALPELWTVRVFLKMSAPCGTAHLLRPNYHWIDLFESRGLALATNGEGLPTLRGWSDDPLGFSLLKDWSVRIDETLSGPRRTIVRVPTDIEHEVVPIPLHIAKAPIDTATRAGVVIGP